MDLEGVRKKGVIILNRLKLGGQWRDFVNTVMNLWIYIL
jgi:hypothetical protein